jgi:multidrug resistance efflux pump
MRTLWKVGLIGLLLVGVGGAATVWGSRYFNPHSPHGAIGNGHGESGPHEDENTVHAIQPKRDSSFQISIERITDVEAFYLADLYARESGVVKFIGRDLNDRVSKGELLVEIDVPNNATTIALKEAEVLRRIEDRSLAEKQVKIAEVLVKKAKLNVERKHNDVATADIDRKYHQREYERVKKLGDRKVADEGLVDEEKLNWQKSEQAYESARIAVKEADASFDEKNFDLDKARADVKDKDAMVQVAVAERDDAVAKASFARICAPFDGVVLKRNVDPGAFVQNAATAHTEPMMTVARTDIVTVVTKVPDNVAPFITTDTDVTIRLDELPGVVIHGKVTRYSPSIDKKDRTMLVKVDLFNGTRQEYDQFVASEVGGLLASFGAPNVLQGLTLLKATHAAACQHHKGKDDRLPLFPEVTGASPGQHKLLPGMSGQMRLKLQDLHNAYLLPRAAVFDRGGKPFILVVRDGVTHLQPVKIQVQDDRMVKLSLITREAKVAGGQDLTKELTGDEVILLNRQTEIGDGKAVHVIIEKW